MTSYDLYERTSGGRSFPAALIQEAIEKLSDRWPINGKLSITVKFNTERGVDRRAVDTALLEEFNQRDQQFWVSTKSFVTNRMSKGQVMSTARDRLQQLLKMINESVDYDLEDEDILHVVSELHLCFSKEQDDEEEEEEIERHEKDLRDEDAYWANMEEISSRPPRLNLPPLDTASIPELQELDRLYNNPDFVPEMTIDSEEDWENFLIGCGKYQTEDSFTKWDRTMFIKLPGVGNNCFLEALLVHGLLQANDERRGNELTGEQVKQVKSQCLSIRKQCNIRHSKALSKDEMKSVCTRLKTTAYFYSIKVTPDDQVKSTRWWKSIKPQFRIVGDDGESTVAHLYILSSPHEDEDNNNIYHVKLISNIKLSKARSAKSCKICSKWFTPIGQHSHSCYICKKCHGLHTSAKMACLEDKDTKRRRYKPGHRHEVQEISAPTKVRTLSSVMIRPQQPPPPQLQPNPFYNLPFNVSDNEEDQNPEELVVDPSITYWKNKYFLDFETFTPAGNNRYSVYSYSLISCNEVMSIYDSSCPVTPSLIENCCVIGEDALDLCAVALSKLPKDSVVITYNGSRFDLFFLFTWFVEHHVPISNILKKDSKIIAMTVYEVKFWDMCLFTFFSLERVCDTMNVPSQYRKKGFDHQKIKSWQDVNAHREEIKDYNFYDVLCLGIAYLNFAQVIYKEFSIDVTSTFTLSHLAYTIWTQQFMTEDDLKNIVLPFDFDNYKWIRKALFGGRCQPQTRGYISKSYNDYVDRFGNVLKTPDKDYKMMLDVVSLYPAASVQGFFPMGSPTLTNNAKLCKSFLESLHSLPKHNPILPLPSEDALGGTKWTKTWISFYKKVMRSLVECDVDCPDTLIIPFLMERNEKDGSLIQNLKYKKNQVYDGYTILMAIFLGYNVVRVHKIMTWPYLSNPLKGFMNHIFEKKKMCDDKSVDYLFWKLLMNSLTGKMSQKWISQTYAIFWNDDFKPPSKHDKVDKVEIIKHSKSMQPIALGVTFENPTKLPSKPLYLGVWILSISRVIMATYYHSLKMFRAPGRSLDYGDTDSFIVPCHVVEEAMSDPRWSCMFGSEIGLLSDDLKGGRIVKAYYQSPKVYALEYVKDGRLFWKIRAKGIPRANQTLDVLKYLDTIKSSDQILKEQKQNALKKTAFVVRDSEGKLLRASEHLDMNLFKLMFDGLKVRCVYGSIERKMNSKNYGFAAAAVSYKERCIRTVNEQDWWDTGVRSKPKLNVMSLPLGHKFFPVSNSSS